MLKVGGDTSMVTRHLASILGRIFGLALIVATGAATSALADFETGWRAYQQADFAAALGEWVPLAEGGDPRAQYNLGVMHDEGKGLARNPALAVEWWRKAAGQGMVRAMHNLANAYIAGEGAAQDHAAAIKWLRAAADKGLDRSQYTLGQMYGYGLGVKQDKAIAAKMFRMAAEQGHDRAQYNLGKMYRDGAGGLDRSAEEAARWFRKAALQGYTKAQSHLGTRYGRGEGVPRDDVEALMWMILAAEKGHPAAIENAKVLRKRMPAEQTVEAERRAKVWKPVPHE